MIKYIIGFILFIVSFGAFAGSATEDGPCIQKIGNDLKIIFHYRWEEKDTIEQLKGRVAQNEWAQKYLFPMIERAYQYENPRDWAMKEIELCKKESNV